MKNTLFAVAAIAACASASAETISLKSPDGRNEITLATEPALTVSVARDGKPVLGPAPISMTFDGKGVIGGAGAKNPTAVRYNWGCQGFGNLYNAAGLPASCFTTED